MSGHEEVDCSRQSEQQCERHGSQIISWLIVLLHNMIGYWHRPVVRLSADFDPPLCQRYNDDTFRMAPPKLLLVAQPLPQSDYVCLSVCLLRCALRLSRLVYRAKSCTSVFLAGMFLFVHSATFAVGCIALARKHTEKTNRRKREREFLETDNQACTGRVTFCYSLTS